jgi:hypothetical protein
VSAPAAPVVAYVALGSNLGDRRAHLAAALLALDALPATRLLAASPVYETAPLGPAGALMGGGGGRRVCERRSSTQVRRCSPSCGSAIRISYYLVCRLDGQW